MLAHNTLADVIHRTLSRVGSRYRAIAAWTSPGLTHRSFLMGQAQRKQEGLPLSRMGTDGPAPLHGVCDMTPGIVDILPTTDPMAQPRTDLAVRLEREGRNHSGGAVRGIYARGDGHDTPLGLPEMLTHLTAWLDGKAGQAQ